MCSYIYTFLYYSVIRVSAFATEQWGSLCDRTNLALVEMIAYTTYAQRRDLKYPRVKGVCITKLVKLAYNGTLVSFDSQHTR